MRAKPSPALPRVAGVCAVVAAFVVAVAPGSGVVARADTVSTALAYDGQDYAPVAPFPDAYASNSQPDTLAIHVGVTAGQPTYYGYIHVGLSGVPQATDEHLMLTFVPISDNTKNVNATAAILSMCVLADPYPAKFNSSSPPRYDCTKGSSVGTANHDGSWTFDASRLLAAWRRSGNTGAAIIPEYQPTDTWAIAFEKTQSRADYTGTLAPTPSPVTVTLPTPAPPTAAPVVAFPTVAPIAVATPVPTPAPTAPPTPRPTPRPPVAAGPGTNSGAGPAGGAAAGSGSGSGTARWAVALALSALAALLLVARPLARAARRLDGPFRPTLLGEMRLHPRAFTMASVLLGWSVAFSGYSLATTTVLQSNPRLAEAPLGQNANGGTGDQGTGAPGSGPGAAATRGPGSPAAPGSVGPDLGAGSAGTGSTTGGNGSTATQPPFNGFGVNLFGPDRDRTGLDTSSIKLCGHTALIFAAAFNISASDLNVFWQVVNANGGINGRQVTVEWNDDVYAPDKAVQAAQKCEDDGAFAILSGIGFDQIPAVRVWAEQHQELYLYHIAVQQGSQGMRYSYTELPSVEQVGRQAGDIAVNKYRGHKVAIIERQSPNWEPGATIFKQMVTAAGGQISDDEYVTNNQGTYTQNLEKMQQSGADVVLVWENALAALNIIQQAHGQNWFPRMIMFPFNLTIQKLSASDLRVPFDGVAAWTAYTNGDYANAEQFGYADEVHRFEAAYAHYDPNAKLNGFGGDLLWTAWTEFKQVQDLLQQCGRDCTRNKLAATLQNYRATVPPNCAVDFTGDHHHAGLYTDEFIAENRNGQNEWLVTQMCVKP